MYRVSDNKGVLNMGGFVNGILYCVADNKGGLRLRAYNCGKIESCRGYQGWSLGGGVLLRVYCIVSRIPMVFEGWKGCC